MNYSSDGWGPHGRSTERLTFGNRRFSQVPTHAAVATAAALAHEAKPVRFSRLETWDWGWGGLLMFSILLFFRPQDQLGLLGAMHLSDVSALIGLSAMAALNLGKREPITRMTPELAAMLGFGGVLLATIPTSFWPGGSFNVFRQMYIQVALIFLLMVNTVTSPRRVERICWVIVLAFGYISARVLFDYLRGVNLVEGDRASGPVGGFFENPNDLALNLVSFLPLALMYVKRPGPALKRMLCAGIALLMVVGIVLTKSRGGNLGFIVMMGVFLLVSRSLTPATVIAIVLGGMVAMPMMGQAFWDRMSSIVDGSKDPTGSREQRREVMEKAWHVFLDFPLTGVGAGQFQNFAAPGESNEWRETHNVVLQIAAELGIFGVIAFFYLVYRGFRAAWRTRRELAWIHNLRARKRGPAPAEPEDGLEAHERYFLQTHGAAMFASLAGWFVCALFASVAFNWTIYYLLGLSITAYDVVRHRREAYAKAKQMAAAEVAVA